MTVEKLSQVKAVIKAVEEVLGNTFISGTTIVHQVITSEQKEKVAKIVQNGIINGTVSCDRDTTNEKALVRYVKGMVNNHLTRSKKLNGSKPYKATKKTNLVKTTSSETVSSQISKYANGIDTSVVPDDVKDLVEKLKQ
jgi:hypothetical protein